MANRWKGNIISIAATSSDGTAYSGKADGAWGLNSQLQQKQANLWAKSVNNPSVPTIGTATAGNANASITFTASSDIGATGTLTYTAISTPGNFTGTGSSSPITVSGLTNGTQYTFVVNATNSLGLVSADSAVSNSTGITAPSAPTIGTAAALPSSASVSFTAPNNTGGLPITNYTATSNPSGITGTGTTSPIIVNGLTNEVAYTFTVTATNSAGFTSPSSGVSNSVTPSSLSLISMCNFSISPYISVFQYSSFQILNKYADPATTPIGNTAANSAFNNDGSILAVASNPMTVYHWSSGFGTVYTNPSLSTGGSEDITFNPDNSAIVLSGYNSPYVHAYTWNNSTGFGTKFANPATSVGSVPGALKFNSSGNTLFMPSSSTPFAHAYAFSSSGFGTKFANPATLPPGAGSQDGYSGKQIALRYTDDVIAFPSNASPWLNIYQWSNGFGTKYAGASDLGTNQARGLAFSPTGNAIVSALRYTPFIAAYAWTNAGGLGTRKASPSLLPGGDGRGVAFTSNNAAVGITYSTPSPYFKMYRWTDTGGFGTEIPMMYGGSLPDAGMGITIYN